MTYCRSGLAVHGRERHPRFNPAGKAPYDVVYGPVSLWRQVLVVKDCDQISFHTTEALKLLPAPHLEDQGSPLFR